MKIMNKNMTNSPPLTSSSFLIRDILSSHDRRDKNYSSSLIEDQVDHLNQDVQQHGQIWNNSLGSANHSVSASFAAAAAALLPSFMIPSSNPDKRIMSPYEQHQQHLHHHHHPFLTSHHDLFLQHISRATASVANHVASHRRRKARTVFSDSQLHGLEKR